MKSDLVFSIQSNSRDDQYGLYPVWSGRAGEELETCPCSFDEAENQKVKEGLEFIGDSPGYAGFEKRDADFSNSNLDGVDFEAARLPGAVFSRSLLRMADFTRAKLPAADFSLSDLSMAEMGMCDLSGARFKGADLCHVNLRSAKLKGADLSGADLEHAALTEADLRGANLDGTDLRSACLTGAIFDDESKLPFSREKAFEFGMVHQDAKP